MGFARQVFSPALSLLAATPLHLRRTRRRVAPPSRAIDPDNNGTLDLNEAKAAASKLFDKRETDKDGTVTAKELQGRLSKKDLAAGDPDKDGTLTKDEYLAIVESRFKAANPDADGTIDCKEAKTKAGRDLLRLLK